METSRPIVLSMAGLDPSGGAGLLADIKTFEEHQVYGLGICTAQTIQTENVFISVRWEEEKEILRALEAMLSAYNVKAIKIGIVENINNLKHLVSFIHEKNPAIRIIWDTVIKSSTGFDFLAGQMNEETLKEVLKKMYLITPNYNEALKLLPSPDLKEAARRLSAYCPVLLKGGHNQEEPGFDYLYANNEVQTLKPGKVKASPKHGSGCVLSSAVTANLALGHNLEVSCIRAKQYIEHFLSSNKSPLGNHHV